MSATLPGATVEISPAPEPDERPAPRRRTVVTVTVVLVLLALAAGVVAAGSPFAGTGRSNGIAPDNGTATSLTTVRRGPLSSQVNQDGTLGYRAQGDGSPYAVVNQAKGALSELPTVGQVIEPGGVLYRVKDNPVILLSGTTPAYRDLSEGLSGPDVQELNADLVALGYATRALLDPSSDYFSAETAYALERLQSKLGVDQTGTLTLGAAVFLPGPLRITKVLATLGTAAAPDAPIAQATSTVRQVVVQLNASQQASVRVGDSASITLPDNRVTPGVVSSVGSVASGSSTNATIPVYISLRHPNVAGRLDQAPVQVQITTAGVRKALIVPVNGLLALAGGGYAVEVVGGRRPHQLVPVTLGLFDDADGLVQVLSSRLAPGEQIVVPGA